MSVDPSECGSSLSLIKNAWPAPKWCNTIFPQIFDSLNKKERRQPSF